MATRSAHGGGGAGRGGPGGFLSARRAERELADEMARCAKDPLRFVHVAFAWGEGDLAHHAGPEAWQREVLAALRDGLADIGAAIRIAVGSGHGVGKSALVAWLILWALATREDTRGIVTANTETQLKTKTWAELAKWHNLSLMRHWFIRAATAIYAADAGHEKTWRVDMVPWSESNTESFAGLHNGGKRVLVVFDEASAIVDEIWEVAEGAMTDARTEMIWAVFGNFTRATGRFRECFRKHRKYWRRWTVDSRDVRFTNKQQLAAWIEAYGEDSDFVRVRIKAEPPRRASGQLISSEVVEAAATREARAYREDPVIFGVDHARFGDDANKIYVRRGRDARTVAPRTYRNVDSLFLAGEIARLAAEHVPDAIFIDAGGPAAGGVIDQCRYLGLEVTAVDFGGRAHDAAFANKRAEMYGRAGKWLADGGAIPDLADLKEDLTGVEYRYVGGRGGESQIILEKKEDFKARMGRSPDDGDAFVLTFAQPVLPRALAAFGPGGSGASSPLRHDYDPHGTG